MKLDNNKYGIIGTIVFHGIVLVILLLCGFSAPKTEFPEPDGIVIDFGEMVMGEEAAPNETTQSETTAKNVESVPQETAPKTVATQESESIVQVKKQDEKRNESAEKTTEKELTPEEMAQQEWIRQQQERANKNFAQNSGNGTGIGGNSEFGVKDGHAGAPNGSVGGNSKGSRGNPFGKGDMSGGKITEKTYDCNTPISFELLIDREGNVIKIDKTIAGALSTECQDAARRAAMTAKFPKASATDKDIRYAKIEYDYSMK